MVIVFSDVQFTWRVEKTLLDASVYMYDLTNFTRLADKPHFVEGQKKKERKRMANHFKEPSFLSLLQWNLLCYESSQLINDSSTSTIKHWNRHKMSALQRFSYISIPLSVIVPRFHFVDIFFLILKFNQHLICCVSNFSLFHLYIITRYCEYMNTL